MLLSEPSPVRGDSASGRGLANGALRHSVPGLQVQRWASSRAVRVCDLVPGLFGVVCWLGGQAQDGRGARCSGACLQKTPWSTSTDRSASTRNRPSLRSAPRIARNRHQHEQPCAGEGAGRRQWQGRVRSRNCVHIYASTRQCAVLASQRGFAPLSLLMHRASTCLCAHTCTAFAHTGWYCRVPSNPGATKAPSLSLCKTACERVNHCTCA